MSGMDAQNGLNVDGLCHLYQSIGKILTTPIGSRVARREFGSELFHLVDAPTNAATRVRLYAASAAALMRWEPRVKVSRFFLNVDDDGKQVLDIEGTTTISGEQISTSVRLPQGSAA